MKKQIFTLLTLLLTVVGGASSAWAETSTFPLQKNADGYTLTKDGITFSGGSASNDGYNVNLKSATNSHSD